MPLGLGFRDRIPATWFGDLEPNDHFVVFDGDDGVQDGGYCLMVKTERCEQPSGRITNVREYARISAVAFINDALLVHKIQGVGL